MRHVVMDAHGPVPRPKAYWVGREGMLNGMEVGIVGVRMAKEGDS